MSWSRTEEGPPNAVLEQVRGWRAEQLQQNQRNGEPDALTNAHDRQIRAVEGAVTGALTNIPADRTMKVTANGHSDPDGTGYVEIRIES